MLFVELLLGALIISCCVAIHAIGFDYIHSRLKLLPPVLSQYFGRMWKTPATIIATLAIFLILIIDVWLWALLYLAIGAFDTVETALYFSLSCFTTLGIGDVVLSEEWRLLSGVEAACGFFLFGWTTAFIFEIIRSLRQD